MNRFLTKSRFKLAIECPSKLFYYNKKTEYADAQLDDPFLKALAKGGFQVGELAKYLFCEDPQKEQITIEELDYATALERTNEKLLGSDNVVIAEAAFQFQNLFVRVDITTRSKKVLNLYEVKAKSWNSEKSFWSGTESKRKWLKSDWIPYLYDIAFQKYVVSKSYPGFEVRAHLILADCDTPASVDGLNELFRIQDSPDRFRTRVKDGTTQLSLGTIPLKIIPVDKECEWIYDNPAEVDLEGIYSFEELIQLFSDYYKKDERIWSPLDAKCKSCQFTNVEHPTLKSGFVECWKHWTGLTDEQLKLPLVLELWGGLAGGQSLVGKNIKNGKFLMKDLEDADYWPKEVKEKIGLTAPARRKMQIDKIKQNDTTSFLDREGLKQVFDELQPPYHFIDFETSMVALPFHAGRRPYEAIAFQYSYHLMDEKGRIEHKSQYLCMDHCFPNYDFVRALRKDLHGKEGTIFRYHNHENTYLLHIYRQLLLEPNGLIPDRDELIDFIKEITHCNDKKDKWQGANDMVDLWQLVISYYYSPAAKGSNSIKDILPAVINDSAFIREKYSKPIYGTDLIPSLNFSNHTWISKEHGMNPYKTLPNILEGIPDEQLNQFFEMDEELRDGGAAMMAYAYLQFTDIDPRQKELIRKALLRYCELDTMAMVMIFEYWGTEIGWFRA